MPEEGQKQMDRNHRKESDKRAEIREESRINGLKPARKEVWTEKKKLNPKKRVGQTGRNLKRVEPKY